MVSAVNGFGMQTSAGIAGEAAERTIRVGQSAAPASMGAIASSQSAGSPRVVSKQ